MGAVSWYRDWFNSAYYHHLYYNRDASEADLFVRKLVEHLQPAPESRMLDIGCGRGRHAISLAAMGYDVTGIDISPDSIQTALESEKENLHFFVHDMRLPFWINYFDYAFNFFTSFGYFRTEREHYDVIRTIAQSLRPGGFLVIDYLNMHYAEDNLVHQAETQIEEVNYLITKWYDESHFYKKIVVEDDRLAQPLEFMEKVAKFSLGDFNDMFSFHELQVQEVFGDYNFSSYDLRKSPRLIMVAQKMKR